MICGWTSLSTAKPTASATGARNQSWSVCLGKERRAYARDKIQQAREFWEAHKMKIGKDYRLEFLKLPKEDIFDFLDVLHSDNVHEWRQSLWESRNREAEMGKEIKKLEEELLLYKEMVLKTDKKT